MITLDSFLHRDEVRDLFARWLPGEFRADDAVRIKEPVNFLAAQDDPRQRRPGPPAEPNAEEPGSQ